MSEAKQLKALTSMAGADITIRPGQVFTPESQKSAKAMIENGLACAATDEEIASDKKEKAFVKSENAKRLKEIEAELAARAAKSKAARGSKKPAGSDVETAAKGSKATERSTAKA